MGRDGPVFNLPFSNLRLKQGIPGFLGRASFRLDDESERRFGEFPWRPREREEEEGEQGKGDEVMMRTEGRGLYTAETNIGRGVEVRREKETRGREERGKEKIEGANRGGPVNLVIADGIGVEKKLERVAEREDGVQWEGKRLGEGNLVDKRNNPILKGVPLVDTRYKEKGESGKGKVGGLVQTEPVLAGGETSVTIEVEKGKKIDVDGYDRLQAEIMALRKEITIFQEERSKPKQNKEEIGLANGPVPPTRVGLKWGLVRPGLGPQRLEQLGLEEEDIGLRQPMVLLDYPSPTHSQCATLGQARRATKEVGQQETLGIKEKVEEMNKPLIFLEGPTLAGDFKRTMQGIFNSVAASNRGSYGMVGNVEVQHVTKQGNAKDGGKNYYVDFSSDEEKEEKDQFCSLPTVMETQLVLGMNHSLSLKRGTEEQRGLEVIEYDVRRSNKRGKGE